MAISQKMKFLDDFKGKSVWNSLLPIFISLYLLFSMVSISLSQIFLSFSFIFWIVMLIKDKKKFVFPAFFWPLIIFSALSLLSSFLSIDPIASFKDSKELLLFLIIPIVYSSFSDVNLLKKANLFLLVSAFLGLLYSTYQFFFRVEWPNEIITGFMGHVMTHAGLLLLFSCMALSLFLFSQGRIKYIWGLGFLFSLIILTLTLVRSSWVGCIIAVSIILYLYKPRATLIIPLAFSLLFFISPKPIKNRALSIFSTDSKLTNLTRLEYIRVGIGIIKDYPLLGTGPATVEKVKQDPKYEASARAKSGVHLHNNIIQIGAERGIPALLAWLTFIVWTFFSITKLLKNKDPTLKPFAVAALAATLGLFTAGLFEYNFGDSEITALFFYIITIPFVLDRVKEKETISIDNLKENKKPKSLRKRILISLVILVMFYFIWLIINMLSFKTYKIPESKIFQTEIEGVYHIHTTFSDGSKSPSEIAKLASFADLDFIILTDHGRPNRKSYSSQGWKEDVLVLAGSELSVSRGHLVGLNFTLPSRRFSQQAEYAAFEITATGGFTIIAHPYSKTQWSWGELNEYSGIEIMNADSMLRTDILPSLPYLPTFLLKPKYFLLKILDNPYRNLRKWDELNTQKTVYGYYSVDAHLLYRPLLDMFHLHLILQRPLSEDFNQARQQVFEALRKGRFYNSVHAAAHGKGFRFWGERGTETIPMGSTTSLDSPVTLHIKTPFSFNVESSLIHNGKSIYNSTEENVSYEVTQAGTYRVEVYLKERSPLRKNIPWIVSNPIFLREDKK